MISEVVPCSEIPAGVRGEMFALMAASFEGVSRQTFEEDLAEKDQAILLTRRGRLCGFTTVARARVPVDGETVNVIYSGDTIVDPATWGSFALARAWIDWAGSVRREQDGERLYWLLICSGLRTYRFMSVFFREFYPRYDRCTPPCYAKLMHALAVHRYGSAFDPHSGLVRLEHPSPLRQALLESAERLLNDPHGAFFARINPGHEHGDELACIAELADHNLTPAGRRMAQGSVHA